MTGSTLATLLVIILAQAGCLVWLYRIRGAESVKSSAENKLRSVQYRVMKMLFRKYTHDVANKIQILLGQHMMIRKEMAAGKEVTALLEGMKGTIGELTDQVRFTRAAYLTEREKVITADSVNLHTEMIAAEASFVKRLAAKSMTIKLDFERDDIQILAEPKSFQKYIAVNILNYIFENAQDGSVLAIECREASPFTELRFDFSVIDAEKVKSAFSGFAKSNDEDNPLLIIDDFVHMFGASWGVSSDPNDKKKIKIILRLKPI